MQYKNNIVLFVKILILLERQDRMLYQRFIKKQSDAPTLCYVARDENLTPGVTYGPVIRDVYIVECCISGYGSVIINGTEFSVSPGDCYILLPGDTIIHTADKVDARSGVWCAISGLDVGLSLARAGIDSKNPYAPRSAFKKITDIIEKMLSINLKKDMGADLYRTACIYEMLSCLLDGYSVSDADSLINKAIGFIEAQYYEKLTVTDVANAVGLERSYFSTVFKQKTGLSPHEYINRFRIQKSCIMLKQGRESVASVADAVGLDPQNFARIFKKETGVSPLCYKKSV